MKCVKCQKEIKIGHGFYNYPSGPQCAECGHKISAEVDKALTAELYKMAKELRDHKKIL